MSVRIHEKSVGGRAVRQYYCDTTDELPSSGLSVGDEAFALDTQRHFIAVSATAWRELAQCDSAGYVPFAIMPTAALAQGPGMSRPLAFDGEDGEQGPIGPVGPRGPQGDQGQQGFRGLQFTTTECLGGQGASSQFGAGGDGAFDFAGSSTGGVLATVYGAGGGGAAQVLNANAATGGHGSKGIIVVDEYT